MTDIANKILEEKAKVYMSGAYAKRTPLSNEQVADILDSERLRWVKLPPADEFALAFARAIERAHGIGNES